MRRGRAARGWHLTRFWRGVQAGRDAAEEAADGRAGDPVQDGPVERLAKRAQRRPVCSGERQPGGLRTRPDQLDVGIQYGKQRAALPGYFPAQR